MTSSLNRRDWLKSVGSFAAATTLNFPALERLLRSPAPGGGETPRFSPDRPVTAIVAGAGNRGNGYAAYSEKFPDALKIVGFAEPIPFRRDRFAARYHIDPKVQFHTWEEIFLQPKFADVVIITTPDDLHYGPAMAALRKGYDLLLEKPIAQTWQQCSDIMHLAEAEKRIVAICHVLRYAPFFRKLKEVTDSGLLGSLVSINWMEPVEHIHMSHSFVRGNWRNSVESNPMLLAKSCHDLDMLNWLIGKPCLRVYSTGSLKWFRSENAPKGSTARCSDGCTIEKECPYSALEIYYRRQTWLHHFDLPPDQDRSETILRLLKTGPYGRCVYRCDNDVVDHQSVLMDFEGEITATFAMEACTSYGGRRIRVMGSMGDIVGDEEEMIATDFITGKKVRTTSADYASITSGHGGGDYGLVHDFLRAVVEKNPRLLVTTVQDAMESHLIGFRAEESRLSGKTVTVRG